jgi:hypothetical protein
MPTAHPPLVAWLRTHHGVVPGHQLGRLGVTRGALATLLKCGDLIEIREGVYRHTLWPDTFHSRDDGIRLTSPARTVFDLSKHLRAENIESVIEQGLRRSLFDIPTLHGVGNLLCRRGRPGSAVFAAVLSSRPTWRRPADSHPEIELRRALSAVGVHLEPQLSLTLADGKTVHPDLGDPDAHFYVEIDEHEWHGGRLAATYDLQRDRLARLVGARIERVSTDEIAAMPPSLLTSLAAAYHQQRTLVLSTRSAC